MDYLCVVVQLGSLLLLICKPGDCYSIKCSGNLTLDQEIIAMGSNLTVRCQSDTRRCGRLFVIEVDKQKVLQETSCSVVTAQFIVRRPSSWLQCKVLLDGKYHIVCGRDIKVKLIPSIPLIKEIVFAKDTLSPSVHWQTTDKMVHLNPELKFRVTHDASDWMEANVTQLHRGEILMLADLEPRTSYQFKLRVCMSALRHNCSLWSQSVTQTSPRKVPLSKLDVWRIIGRNEGNCTQNVTVLWKAFTSEDHEGELQGYELVYQHNETTHTLNLSSTVTQHSLQLPLEVTKLNVCAVTSAGRSPSVAVSLINTGRSAPMIYVRKTAGGRILLHWNTSHTSDINTSEETLGFVVQWQCSSLKAQWMRIRRDQNFTFIHGTAHCPSYNISLYVERSEGVSVPTFGQIESKEEKMETLPERIVPQMMSTLRVASTGHKDGMAIGIGLITVLLVIIANLMYLRCTRQRMRKVCMSVGPSCLFEHLPKVGDSNAIKLLKDDTCSSDPCWQQMDSDPPLSPVEDFNPPVERKSSYPAVHTEDVLEDIKTEQNLAVCPYKPQPAFVSQRRVAVSETDETEEDENPWVFSSPAFTNFDEVFFPSQGMHGPLNSCLTVNGAQISVDIEGLLFLSQTSLEENMWRAQGDATLTDTVNGDQNKDQGQTVLPNDLMRCLREPTLMPDPARSKGMGQCCVTQRALRNNLNEI